MFIQTEETPNPMTVKFLPGQNIIDSGTFDFSSAGDAVHAPLVKRLFAITGVSRVFLSTDFVSVTRSDDTDWNMLKPMILAALMEHLSMGYPVLEEAFFDSAPPASDQNDGNNEIVLQIKALLDERVRPMVAMDGGDIVFDRFDDGIVYLRMQGACSGCPSATETLKMGVENMLKHYIPEVVEVRPSSDTV